MSCSSWKIRQLYRQLANRNMRKTLSSLSGYYHLLIRAAGSAETLTNLTTDTSVNLRHWDLY